MSWYRFILSLHIIAVISWMAGLLYLLRLFVYHRAESEEVVKERFKLMERRLYAIITRPAMVAALIFGVVLVCLTPSFLHESWMHLKLCFVVLLIGVTHFAGSLRQKLEIGPVVYGDKFLRVVNEIPTLLMILIIFAVVMKPF